MPSTASGCCDMKTMRLMNKMKLLTKSTDTPTLQNILKTVGEQPSLYDEIEDTKYKAPAAAYMFMTAHENARVLAFFARKEGMIYAIAKAMPWYAAQKHANYLELRCLLLSPKEKALEIIVCWCQHLIDGLSGQLWVTTKPLFFRYKIAPVLVFKDKRVALLANEARNAHTAVALNQILAEAKKLLVPS